MHKYDFMTHSYLVNIIHQTRSHQQDEVNYILIIYQYMYYVNDSILIIYTLDCYINYS